MEPDGPGAKAAAGEDNPVPVGLPAWAPRALARLLAFVFAAALIAAVFARVAQTVRGPFRLVPTADTGFVASPVDGKVAAVLVDEGQMVRAGETLFLVSPAGPEPGRAGPAVSVPSPADGMLLSVAAQGQLVAAGAPLAQVVGDAAALLAAIDLPEEALALVREGQPVRLVYFGYPHQRFGVQPGTVSRVNAVPVDIGGRHALRAYARVPATIRAGTGSYPLRAGLRGEARVVLGREPLINQVLDPFGLRAP